MVLGLASVVFLYLLVRSKYIPRMLIGFGVLSYALVFLSNRLAMTSPDHATGRAPSVLSEPAIGSWLQIGGARVREA